MAGRRKKQSNEQIVAQNENQLELIKVNVEKVKKDVSEVSVFTKKEIESILKKIDVLMAKLERSNELMLKKNKTAMEYLSDSVEQLNEDETKLVINQMKGYASYAQKRLDDEKKIQKEERKTFENNIRYREQEAKSNRKKLEDQLKIQKQLNDEQLKRIDDRFRDNENKQSAFRSAMKGDLSGIINYNTDKKKENISNQLDALTVALGKGDISQAQFDQQQKDLMGQYSSINESAGKMKAGAKIFETSVKILKSFADIWLARFKTGMDNIVKVYEETYQKQAVLSGINEEQYQQAQKDMRDNINQMGLQDNLAVTEVMQATSEYISNGITDFGKASQLGQTAAIAKVLAPYLDTQSDAFITLSQAMGPNFSKTMMGLGKNVSEQLGQSRFLKKNMDKMVDDMQYMTLAARKSLMSEREQAMLEALTMSAEEGGAGMTMQQATEFYTNMQDVLTNRGKALESGGLMQQVAASDMSVVDAKSYMAAAGTYVNSLYAGTNTNTPWGQLEYDAIRNSTGDSGMLGYNVNQANMSNILSGNSALLSKASSNNNNETAIETYQDMLEKMGKGDFTTAKQEKDILAENLAVEMAIYQEKWPDLMKVLWTIGPEIVSGITMWLGSKLLGKFGNGLLKGLTGSGGGGSLGGIGSTLATGLGKGGLYAGGASSAVAATAGIAGAVYGTYATIRDAKGGVEKTKEWLGEETTGNKIAAGVGGALGGTGPGAFDKKASTGDKLKNIGKNTAKGAAIGAAIGTIIPGAGTAAGAAVGGVIGAGLGIIGGENIAKAAKSVGDFFKDRFNDVKQVGGKLLNIGKDFYKNFLDFFPKMGESLLNGFKSFTTFLTELPAKIVKGLKWGMDTYFTAIKNMFAGIVNIPAFIGNTAISAVNGIKNALKNNLGAAADNIGQGDFVRGLFPNDMPSIPYAQMSEMPDIGSYATGKDYIYSTGVATLHEGEAVLTKSAASILRENTSLPVSSVAGVNDALNARGMSVEATTAIVNAISNQTFQLVSKMDEILTYMRLNRSSPVSYSSDVVNFVKKNEPTN